MTAFSKTLISVSLFTAVSVGLGLWLTRSRDVTRSSIDSTPSGGRISPELAAQVAQIEANEQKASETVWAKEILAQECGRTFEGLWDSLNTASNKLSVIASFPVAEIVSPKWNPPQSLPHGIELREPSAPGVALSPEEWHRFIEKIERDGWKLAQAEFRHNAFDTDKAGKPRQSRFYFSGHLTNSISSERAVLEGDLLVDWAAKVSSDEPTPVKRIDARHLTLMTRRADPGFRSILLEQIAPPENSYSIDPLILYDLDGDGLSEIILAGKNLVFRRHSPDHYEPEPLCQHSPGLISTALIADFDGDGSADFLCLRHEGLILFRGSKKGTFVEPEKMVWPATADLRYPMVLTCGDIDHDGDLDLFLGQYKVPYKDGAMPTPYYDANDGHPAYLLLNDGRGNFTDATDAAGLGRKRGRRSYSSSWVDLDGDGNIDLVVVSDFAGVDIYQNDGRGHFNDVTRKWISEPHGFGMGHALADFNADGRLDLLMIGMTSPTVNRLEHLDLWRSDVTEDHAMRSRMTRGNRLYLGRSNGGFESTTFSDSISRSGWAWGCTAFDFDNDGFPDVYIGNGLESRQSVHDYEAEYWLHDAYVGTSNEDSAAYLYFQAKFSRTRGRGQSYGGYEKNRLYLNQRGASFIEIGHLLGVGMEQDSRNVVSDDLDGDGRIDLLVTSFEAWPEGKQTLRVYKNTLNGSGNWIGFRLREEGDGRSPVGTRLTIRYGDHINVRQIVTGDSYRSQHANTVHFGLGTNSQVDSVEIRWPDGETAVLRDPAVNRYHSVRGLRKNRLEK
ncbi:MAG: CRTAC1 family protein [Pedosphaera sp.]|nr:CRTAC1 family protein [Pedosphaera sp.]